MSRYLEESENPPDPWLGTLGFRSPQEAGVSGELHDDVRVGACAVVVQRAEPEGDHDVGVISLDACERALGM